MSKRLQAVDIPEITRVVYHMPCSDGFGGAYVFWKKLSELNENQIPDKVMFVAASHSTPKKTVWDKIVPLMANQNVVFVDFTYPPTIMIEIQKICKKLLILDHHKSAKEILNTPKLVECSHFDMAKSGAVLAWDFCYPSQPVPKFLKCIEDRDLWRWEDKDTKPFTSAFYKSVPFEFDEYAKFENQEEFEHLLNEGHVLQKYDKIEIENLSKRAVECKWMDFKIQVLNSGAFVSEVGNYLVENTDCDFAMVWHYDHKNECIKASLRSNNDKKDVCKVALMFGGGGHRNAAGFTYKGSIREMLNNHQEKKPIECEKETECATVKNVVQKYICKNWKILAAGILGFLIAGQTLKKTSK